MLDTHPQNYKYHIYLVEFTWLLFVLNFDTATIQGQPLIKGGALKHLVCDHHSIQFDQVEDK